VASSSQMAQHVQDLAARLVESVQASARLRLLARKLLLQAHLLLIQDAEVRRELRLALAQRVVLVLLCHELGLQVDPVPLQLLALDVLLLQLAHQVVDRRLERSCTRRARRSGSARWRERATAHVTLAARGSMREDWHGAA
jgi:hypothetical protein